MDEKKALVFEALLWKSELNKVLQVLQNEKVDCILMKGMPLSYQIYSQPIDRPFSDIDVLIQKKDFEVVRAAMLNLGYYLDNAVEGDYVSHQRTFTQISPAGFEFLFDFHWKISNSALFSEVLLWDELWPKVVPIETLGKNAKALCLEHALILACIHRAAHHPGEDRPIWIEDIHRLLSQMDSHQLHFFCETVSRKKIAAICWDGVQKSLDRYKTKIPDKITESLKLHVSYEKSATAYLKSNAKLLRNVSSNLKTLPTFRQKTGYLRELFFPSKAYMMAKYHSQQIWLLPFLYIRRAAKGVFKAFTLRNVKN